ncbi:unnamed protein product [Cyprideis torosa]|uniref:3-hydroxyacyl-CoA dehydrogenase n=1 Tax=Cyprideis torosa TaxID=163714 RepID=A0A7R8W8J9_9CRUS|nr:unnamed protein product [Cyprideis torosa]CAG0887562.1 unnamed protein product [Cyprideis torosa]
MAETKKVAIIGSGFVGRSWAMIFASKGYSVCIYDIAESQLTSALNDIGNQLKALEKSGMIRGNLKAEQQVGLIKATQSFEEAIRGAFYIQECVPEVQSIKADVFNRVAEIFDDDAIIASSTSYMVPSLFTKDMRKGRDRALVAHPVNPPYYAPLIEIVPAPWTAPSAVQKVRDLMREVGQAPVTLAKETMGFSLNRIQVAIIMECWRQVESGLLSLEDVDTVMWGGLGMRYAFLGPLEVAHLNAEGKYFIPSRNPALSVVGMKAYLRTYGEAMLKAADDLGPVPHESYKEGTPTANDICRQLEELVPLDQLQARRAWRDKRVAALAKLKKDLDQSD